MNRAGMTSPHGRASRPPALGTRGVVCSSHYLASQAGMRLLHAGGNAVDAILATAAALGVVEPHMSGPGGDGFLMLHSGGDIRCLNGAGAAPLAVTQALYADGIPYKGIRSVSVPGLVSLWLEAHASAGQRPLTQVFAPACELAEGGFPVSAKLAAALATEAAAGSPLFTHPASAAVFAPNAHPLREGEICRNPDYARTLRKLAQDGPDAFYRGPIASESSPSARSRMACSRPRISIASAPSGKRRFRRPTAVTRYTNTRRRPAVTFCFRS